MLLLQPLVFATFCYITVAVQVTVKQGILEGTQEQLVTGNGTYFSFKGIPYAAPPIADLRFRPPQPALNWTGVRNASIHGSVCTQSNLLTNEITGTEDCLFLNAYTNDLTPKTPRPVMFFIPGGGKNAGSGNAANYGPDILVSFDVVLVTINYRLDALGFLSLGTKDVQGNAGLKDQVAALQWVQANIAVFGGDPKNVTIFGQSSGGADVTLHMLSSMSKGLFQKAIAMSGTAMNEWALTLDAKRKAFSLGRLLGLDTEDPTALTTYLKSLDATQLVGLTPNVLAVDNYARMVTKMFEWTAVTESDGSGNNFLTSDPVTLISKKGLANDVNFMFGHTKEESFTLFYFFESKIISNYQTYRELFAPKRIMDNVNPLTTLQIADQLKSAYFGNATVSNATNDQLIRYMSDCNYNYDIEEFGRKLPDSDTASRYLYQFSAVSGRNFYGNLARSRYNTAFAGHFDDLFYLFDPKAFNLPLNATELSLIQQFGTLITNFAKYGDPTPKWITNSPIGTVIWPVFNKDDSPPYLDFGTDAITVSKGLDAVAKTNFDAAYSVANIGYGK